MDEPRTTPDARGARFEVDRKALAIITGLALLLLLPPVSIAIGEPFLVSLFSRILIYALAAVSLDLILGYGGMVSFGHAAYFGAGAYVVAVLAFYAGEGVPGGSENALVAWPLAALVSAVLAAGFGAVSLRTSGIHFIMITLAFAQMLFFFFVSLETFGGDDGLNLWTRSRLFGLDLGHDATFYYVCLTLLLAFIAVCHRLVNSRFGMVIRGCKQNERRMQALGFPTYRYKLTCFILAGAGAGLAGALIANQTEFVSPGLLHWTRSGEILVMVILGGMGTLVGPVVGAATLLLMEEVLSAYTEYWMVFLGPFLILVVLFAKRGLYGLIVGADSESG